MANIPQWKVGDVLSASKLNAMVDAINNLLAEQEVDVSNFITIEQLTTILEGYSDVGHTHTISEIVDLVLPTVPTRTSQLTNDSDFATNASVDEKIANVATGGQVDLTSYAKKTDLPTKTSQLTNDSDFATNASVDEKIANVGTGGIVPVTQVEPLDDIPKVFFNGDKPTDKTSVYATIEYISKTKHFKGYVDIKCQGTSSMAYPKKNYTIKIFTDETMETKLKQDFKGWGKQSKFCLKANYIDHSHARNICSAKLWNEIVESRSNYEALPELLRTSPKNGAIDGFPIKVYYNNTYEGLYTWNIPKDKWMFNMDDSLDNHCVLCGEEYVSGCFRAANASVWSDEIHDVMPQSIATSFNNFITFVMNSSDEEFRANLENYVYVDSLIDYYIFQYVICGLDSMGKNQLFATYDGTKWIATSYDMDSTFGLYWNGQSLVSAQYRMQEDYESMTNGRAGNLLYVRLEQIFPNEIRARYNELRNTVLSYTNVVNTFERFMDVPGKDLYAEDGTIYTGIPSQATNNIQQIRNYYRDRLTYVDAQIAELRVPVPCTAISLSANTLSLTNDNKTATLVATVTPSETTDTIIWSVTPTGICTVNNGLVTAKANGDCTITVTCGQQSATCSVNVSELEDQPLPDNILFELSEPIIGDGTESTPYIDTNIQLMSEENINNNWTILVECMGNAADQHTVVHCMWEDIGYPGISIDYTANNLRTVVPNDRSTIAIPNALGTRIGIAIVKNGNTFTIYDKLGNVKNTAEVTPQHHNSTLVIGAYKTTDGQYGRYLNGEIYNFRVSSEAYTTNQIIEYFNQGESDLPLNELVYELNEPQVLDGSSKYIDTQIPLCQSNMDYTIFMNFKMNAGSATQAAILHCMVEQSPYPGISLQVSGPAMDASGANIVTPMTRVENNTAGAYLLSSQSTEEQLFVLRKQGTTIELISKVGKASSVYNHNAILNNLLLGAYQDINGNIGRYANITINQAKVWTKALTDEEIQSLING